MNHKQTALLTLVSYSHSFLSKDLIIALDTNKPNKPFLNTTNTGWYLISVKHTQCSLSISTWKKKSLHSSFGWEDFFPPLLHDGQSTRSFSQFPWQRIFSSLGKDLKKKELPPFCCTPVLPGSRRSQMGWLTSHSHGLSVLETEKCRVFRVSVSYWLHPRRWCFLSVLIRQRMWHRSLKRLT